MKDAASPQRSHAIAAGRRIGGGMVLLALALACPSWSQIGTAAAGELVDRNPFDPHRRPWKAPPQPRPELPELTPEDLQIEAIVSFGQTRGIVAQLDGKLRGTLPGNAAGKVRISVGQHFGAGYVLESIDANQAVILGGSTRYTIPLIRKANRGSAPIPATLAAEQRAAPPVVAPVASPPASNPPGAVPGAAGAAPGAAAQLAPVPPPAPPRDPALAVAESAPSAAPQQPMSLLEAIQAAQEAARNQKNPSQPTVNPFTLPRK